MLLLNQSSGHPQGGHSQAKKKIYCSLNSYCRIQLAGQAKTATQLLDIVKTYPPSPAMESQTLLLQKHSSEEMKKSSMSKLLAQLLIEELNQNVDNSNSNFLRLISFLKKLTSDYKQKLGPLKNNIQSEINTEFV